MISELNDSERKNYSVMSRLNTNSFPNFDERITVFLEELFALHERNK